MIYRPIYFDGREAAFKFCNACKTMKSSAEFYIDSRIKTGDNLLHICKSCTSERGKANHRSQNNAPITEGSKVCSQCGVEKHITEFVIKKRNKSGRDSLCKECASAKSKENKKKVNYPRKEEGTKVCTKCKKEKDVNDFGPCPGHKDGLGSHCKECVRVTSLAKNTLLHYPRKEKGTKGCNKCSEEKDVSEFWSDRRNKADGLSRVCKTCSGKANRQYDKIRYATNMSFRLSSSLRRRMYMAVKNDHKAGSAVRDLGCSIEFFKSYLEDRFYLHPETGEEMNWDNYGNGPGKWQIHHIIPMSTLKASGKIIPSDQIKKVCYYTNMKPLWHVDHAKVHSSRVDVLKRRAA